MRCKLSQYAFRVHQYLMVEKCFPPAHYLDWRTTGMFPSKDMQCFHRLECSSGTGFRLVMTSIIDAPTPADAPTIEDLQDPWADAPTSELMSAHDSEDQVAQETANQMFQRMKTHRMLEESAGPARPALQTGSSTAGTSGDRQHSAAAASSSVFALHEYRPSGAPTKYPVHLAMPSYLQPESSTGTNADRLAAIADPPVSRPRPFLPRPPQHPPPAVAKYQSIIAQHPPSNRRNHGCMVDGQRDPSMAGRSKRRHIGSLRGRRWLTLVAAAARTAKKGSLSTSPSCRVQGDINPCLCCVRPQECAMSVIFQSKPSSM